MRLPAAALLVGLGLGQVPGPAPLLAQAPSLAGQPSCDAITQLLLFREGRRDNPVNGLHCLACHGDTPAMSEALAGVSAAEVADLVHALAHRSGVASAAMKP